MTLELPKSAALRFAILASVGMLACFPAEHIAASHPSEYQVKAAYLYNFGRFVEWPSDDSASPADTFNICVMGHDPFGSALDRTISGEKIGGKSIAAKRITSAAEATVCRILFISLSEDRQVKEILSSIGSQSVLTVSDMPQFMQQGGMVQFILVDERVRFAINLAATQQAGLNLSSQLLKVAAEVRGNSRSGN